MPNNSKCEMYSVNITQEYLVKNKKPKNKNIKKNRHFIIARLYFIFIARLLPEL